MFTKQKASILMIDNEPLMIDRRIILEAQSLSNHGYRVVIATRSSPSSKDEFIDNIEIKRFPTDNHQSKHIEKYKNVLDIINKLNNEPGNHILEAKVRTKLKKAPRKFQTLIYALLRPSVLTSYIKNASPFYKKKQNMFDPVIYLLLLRFKSLSPYILRLYYGIQIKVKGHHNEIFQIQILDFAKNNLRPDFIHAHDLPNLELGISISKLMQIPLIYDAHELYPHQFFENKSTQSSLAKKEQKLIGKADAVVAVNQQCKNILQKAYHDIQEVITLSNATLAPEGFDPKKKQWLWHDKFNLNKETKILVFQGGINPSRHIDFLIESLNELPDNIHIGFITFKKDQPYYLDLTEKLNVTHRVHYIFEIPWDEVIHWLASSDVGIMPYQATNLNAKISSPNKLYEFIQAGLPIIGSSELINVKHAIESYNLGVCQFFRELDSYTTAIQLMFSEELGGPERFKASVLKAIPEFSWSREEPKLLELYSRLAHKKR